MKTLTACCAMAILFVMAHQNALSQSNDAVRNRFEDPCGYPDTTHAQYQSAAALNWGYGFDSLKADLGRWAQSPFVRVDSVGATVQNRAMYLLTIQDTASTPLPRKRVWVHARTHPNEVQGTWVTNEMIRYLLGSSPYAKRLRDSCIFNIMPMYNPDGVELALPRQNANGVDIESNWSAATQQPEVQVLRRVFTQLMSGPHPIRVALNMHSAIACKRYFVYHAASGTSSLLATMQQNFIGLARDAFPGGIEPYTYFVSWTSPPPPTVYPESWFWYNHREAVLANTYEDMNCSAASNFDLTARAILEGVGGYLNIGGATSVAGSPELPQDFALMQNYPNPFNPTTQLGFRIASVKFVSLKVFDVLGKEVATLVNENLGAGSYEATFDANGLGSGVYLYRLHAGDVVRVRRMVVLR